MSHEHVPDENPENLDPNIAFLADLDHQMDVLAGLDDAFSLMQQYEAEVKQAADEAAARSLIQSVFEPHPDIVDFEGKVRGVNLFMQDHPEATDQENDQMAARIFNVESPKMPQYPKLQYRRITFDPALKEPDMVDEIYEQRRQWPLHEGSTSTIEMLQKYPGLLKLMKEVIEGRHQ